MVLTTEVHSALMENHINKNAGDAFTKGTVTRNYYGEALLQQQEMLANSRSNSTCSSTSSCNSSGVSTAAAGASSFSGATAASLASQRRPMVAATCQTCGEKWKITTSLRDVMRDVKKALREGYVYCAQCNQSAFQRSDIGMGKKIAYCKVCELVLCGSCCQTLLTRPK